jgi:cytochrome P450
LVEALREVLTRRRRSAGDGDDVLDLLIRARSASDRPLDDDAILDQLVTLIPRRPRDDRELDHLDPGRPARQRQRPRSAAARARGRWPRLQRRGPGLPPLPPGHLPRDAASLPGRAIVSRELGRPFRLGDRWLPAGVFLTPCAYLAHRRPDAFAEPTAFCPERFLGRRYAPHVYFPFGGGARRCLGMGFAVLEMQIVLGILLRSFRFHPWRRVPCEASAGP